MSQVNSWQIKLAAEVLLQGGVIAYPTEAVWGLGCDPFDPVAVEHILTIKRRPIEKGMILVSGQIAHFEPWIAPLSDAQKAKLQLSWPGPRTWLLPDVVGLPHWVKGNHDKVALRVTAHPLVAALTARFGGPIISTSANPAGKPPARTALRVRQYFPSELDGLLPGVLGGNPSPTAIHDIETDVTVRS